MKRLYTFILLVLLTTSSYFLADTIDAFIGRSLEAAPAAAPYARDITALEPKQGLSDYSSILDRGLFGEGKGLTNSPATGTSGYRLIGTIEGDRFAGAVLEDTSGQTFYCINQKLPDGSVIIRVMRDKISIGRPDGSVFEMKAADEMKIVSMPMPGRSVYERKLPEETEGAEKVPIED
jgi:hypothetical protein